MVITIKVVRYGVAILNTAAATLLLAMSVDPYLGDMQNFYFPCEPCGWYYRTKFIYFLTIAVPGILLLFSSVVAWRAKRRPFLILGLALLPVGIYVGMFLSSRSL